MPRINFSNVPDAGEYSPVPAGRYLCTVADIEEDTTRDNDEMWKLKLRVEYGEYKGRNIYDNMVFSQKAMSRVKLICSRFGIDVSGEVDLQPNLLIGREALVDVEVEPYTDKHGQAKERNTVPFAGYHRPGEEDGAAPVGVGAKRSSLPPSVDDDLPF